MYVSLPTAQASVGEMALIAHRTLDATEPGIPGFGDLTWVQLVPFQCHVSVLAVALPVPLGCR